MKKVLLFLITALGLLFSATAVRAELIWKIGDPLLTDASQITSNNSQNGFPPSNLLRPESEGYGTGQIIWHTSWGDPAIPPAGTDTYLQVQFKEPQQHIFFSMIGSMWNSTYDTPTEMIIQGATLPDGEWADIIHLQNMENDFTSFRPDKYTSEHIDLGAAYSYLRFVVKKTINNGNASRYDGNGNPFVSLGRFQVYQAYQGEPDPDPVGPVWKKEEALLTDASQISSNNSQDGFPPSNLLRPESEGYGTGEIIWHTSWGNPPVPPAGTDTYLQVQFKEPEQHIIFSMIGSMWSSTFDTPTEMIIQGATLPDGEWTEITHLTDMQNDFTSFRPDLYTSPHIDLGAEYSYLRFVVKNTMTASSGRRDSNGNPYVSLGRFQVYRAVEGEPDPIEPKDNINLLFIGNSITAGATLSNASTQAPPIVCGKLVEGATGVTTNVYNGGHSGITTLGFLPGRDDFIRLLAAAKAYQKNNGGLTYVSIMLGTNDSACSGTEGAPVSPDTYGTNIRKIIDALIAGVPGCKIVLNYPIWYSPSTHNGATYLQEGLDRLHSYYPVLDEIIKEYDQVYAGYRGVWEFFEDNKVLFTKENGNSGEFFLHPNAQGAQRLAEIWARSLLELIQADGVEIKQPLTAWNTFQPSNLKKYTMATPRGKYGTLDGKWSNTVKEGIGATEGEFAILTYNDKTFLYSVADKQFAYRDPIADANGWYTVLFSNEYIEPTKVHYTGVNANYPYCITIGGYIANSAGSTGTGVVVNTWNSATDGGNQTAIIEAGDFDPTEALAVLEDYYSNEVPTVFRIVSDEGEVYDEMTMTVHAGKVVSEVPVNMTRKAYTLYNIKEPVTIGKGKDNVVDVIASFQLPFSTSPDIANAHWYNLVLREGSDYVTAANNYVCNINPTLEELTSDEYQWAFQGNPYAGIIVYNRSTGAQKTLGVQGDKAVLVDDVYHWQIFEHTKGFLLGQSEGVYINEYGGAGNDLGFWGNKDDVGNIFTVEEVGQQTVKSVKLSTGATLKIFKADEEKANGAAVIICPGGGYSYVAGGYEGADWAPLLNELGFTASVLTYRMPNGTPTIPLNDGKAALKYLRKNAGELNLRPDRIGVMGFSAGGHLASTIATHVTGADAPAFQILYYPVITMEASYTHAGSRENLLGANPPQSLVDKYSNEKQVTPSTPTAYLCWADNDGTVPPANSIHYAAALREAGVPVHTRNFPTGGHGFGFNTSYAYHNEVVRDLTEWLQWLQAEILTGIVTPGNPRPAATLYDLNGRAITAPAKGLYIQNHQKVLVR
ncbi:MAG: alpha/beta hydrolase fold domain-containing protein [Bacteroidaceae bacterium]|nr:alpha/beta hydrolase fold domain-containing protein [Bacteroidaceae bacterium]